MRLATHVLSHPLSDNFEKVEGFLGKKLKIGEHRRIKDVGKVGVNFFCKECNCIRTFLSEEEFVCLCVSDHIISIDCTLTCSSCENTTVQMWFLIECEEGDFSATFPKVRVFKYRHNLSESVLCSQEGYGDYSELLEKAEQAYRDELGAGAIVYLRIALEKITCEVADAVSIIKTKSNGKPRPFKELLEEVDTRRKIIPDVFSENGYKLFGELSEIIHSNHNEQIGLQKYEPCRALVVGIIKKVKEDAVLRAACNSLWGTPGGAA